MVAHWLHSVTWNLFLAGIPVVLAYVLGWGLVQRGKRRNLPLIVCLPIAIAWVLFLPNACYLITEWRHLLFDEYWAPLLQGGKEDPNAMLSTAKWAVLFLGYSSIGMLLFVLAIRPVERYLKSAGHKTLLYAPIFFLLISLGVYLGLIVRLNSWDVFQRPSLVWAEIQDAFEKPSILTAIAVFAGVLWAMYEAVDIWVDGVSERVQRWGRRGTGGSNSK